MSDSEYRNPSGWAPNTRATTEDLSRAFDQVIAVIKSMPDDQFCAFARALDGLLARVGPSVLTSIAEAYDLGFSRFSPPKDE